MPVIIGREAELSAGEDFLGRIREGPAALVLEGEAGIGKTVLWNAIVERAVGRSCCVLSARAVQAEAKLSFVALSDLLSGLNDDVLQLLPDIQQRALDAALLRREPTGAATDRRAVCAALVSTLTTLARKRPTVVAIDDAQWLDGPSAAVLAFAARRLGSEQIGLLLSIRTDHISSLPLGLDAALPAERLERHRIGPLSLGALGELLRERLRSFPSRPLLLRIAEASRGNPFFALEIGRELESSGLPPAGEPLPLPANLSELVTGRIQRLPARTREALLVAAAVAEPTVELVVRASGGAASVLAKAEDSGVIALEHGRVRFTHPLLASAVYGSASQERRRELHQALSALLTDDEERARHLALAARERDRGVADALADAASSARARGAPEAAAELLEQSLSFTPAECGADRQARMAAAAEDYFHAGDRSRARGLLEELTAALPPGPARAASLRLCAEVRFYDDSYADALRLLEEALSQAGDAPDLRCQIELDFMLTLVCGGNMPAAAPHAVTALEVAERAAKPGLLAEALATAAVVEFVLGRGIDHAKLERAVALEDFARRTVVAFRPSYIAGYIALHTGELIRARSIFAGMRTRLLERGEVSDLPALAFLSVPLECLMGDLAAASRLAEEAVAISFEFDSRTARGMALTARSLASAYLGRVEDAQRDGANALALFQETGFAFAVPTALSAIGFLALSCGDTAATHTALEPLADLVAAMGLGEPAAAGGFLPDEIEALLSLGELERAHTLIAHLEERGRLLDRAWALATGARCRALFAAATGDLDGGLSAASEALRHHERLEMPFELARTLLVLGSIQRRRRERLAAKATLERALNVFETIGTPLWAAKAKAEVGRIGLRHAAAEELTATERRVAELVVSGLSNREVAATAFMTEKSVEANLTRAYRKLGVRSRVQLAARITERH